jgi:MarR family transcriptional regulator, organic hydroperoxide resistance regulator
MTTRGDGSVPDDSGRPASSPASDVDADAATSIGLGSIPGLPVAVAPLEGVPLEVLLPRVGAAVARHHRRLAARHGLTPTAVAVLAALDPGDVPSHRDLAARIGLSPATLTPVLDRLEETGDVRRERNRRDRRVVHVHRTAAGGTRLVGARRPDGCLPQPAADSEQVVRAWLLAVLFAAEADE